MWVRFAFFAAGYVMGTKAGRERYHQLVALARWAAGRDEVRTGLSLVQSAIQVILDREELQARRRAA